MATDDTSLEGVFTGMYDIVVVIASFNRLKLIKQTIESINKNSVMKVKIVVVDNSKNTETPEYLKSLNDIIYWHYDGDWAEHVIADTDIGRALQLSEGSVYWDNRVTVGKSYMKGAELSPPSKYILFVQNDFYFVRGWDKTMAGALDKYKDLIMVSGYSGSQESEGQPIGDRQVRTAGKLPGSNMLFRREDWDMIGAFPDYDEDNWICAEIRDRYKKNLGLIYPYILIHTGETSTLVEGKEVERTKTSDWINFPELKKQYPKVIFE